MKPSRKLLAGRRKVKGRRAPPPEMGSQLQGRRRWFTTSCALGGNRCDFLFDEQGQLWSPSRTKPTCPRPISGRFRAPLRPMHLGEVLRLQNRQVTYACCCPPATASADRVFNARRALLLLTVLGVEISGTQPKGSGSLVFFFAALVSFLGIAAPPARLLQRKARALGPRPLRDLGWLTPFYRPAPAGWRVGPSGWALSAVF